MAPSTASEALLVFTPVELKNRLRALSAKSGAPISFYVRLLIEEGLPELERKGTSLAQ
jgi:predicted DNA-binding protein